MKNGIYAKFLKKNFIVFVLPFLIFSIVTIYTVIGTSNRKIHESQLLILKQIEQQFQNVLDDAVELSNYFYYSKKINHIVSSKEMNEYQKIQNQKIMNEFYLYSLENYKNVIDEV